MSTSNPSVECLKDAGLTVDDQGIWVGDVEGVISYPETGHESCAQIEGDSFWFSHRNQVIQTVARKWLETSGPVLDVGAGNGYVSQALAEIGFSVVHIEPGRDGCCEARRRGLPVVVQATLAGSGLVAGAAAGVGLFDVIEHQEDDVAFLAEVLPALRPGGHVIATVPAYQSLWSQSDVDAGHFRRYRQGQLAEVFTEAGLDVRYSTYFFSILPPAIAVGRSLKFRLGGDEPNAGSRQRSRASQHRSGTGPMGRVATKILRQEISILERGLSIPAGGSILMVGEKPLVLG